MKRTEVESWLTANGWTRDRWGHFHATQVVYNETRQLRMKMQATSCRYGIKTNSGDWLNFRSDYYKNCFILDNSLMVHNLKINACQ